MIRKADRNDKAIVIPFAAILLPVPVYENGRSGWLIVPFDPTPEETLCFPKG
jgi:hypothetical protein